MAGARLNRSGGSLVLDSQGLSLAAAGNPGMLARLVNARRRDARVVMSAVTLAETVRGVPRDAAVNRVVGGITVIGVDASLARAAGRLLGETGLPGRETTVDAVVAATALAQPGPIVIVTSDRADMARLTAGRTDATVTVV